jgi:hypothetical protein
VLPELHFVFPHKQRTISVFDRHCSSHIRLLTRSLSIAALAAALQLAYAYMVATFERLVVQRAIRYGRTRELS